MLQGIHRDVYIGCCRHQYKQSEKQARKENRKFISKHATLNSDKSIININTIPWWKRYPVSTFHWTVWSMYIEHITNVGNKLAKIQLINKPMKIKCKRKTQSKMIGTILIAGNSFFTSRMPYAPCEWMENIFPCFCANKSKIDNLNSFSDRLTEVKIKKSYSCA